MSYEVLARRWRPMTFDSVVGQAHITRTLAHAIERDRVPHAFLFTGIRGVGKTTVARLLARALNCTGGKGAEPCNSCPSCEQNLLGGAIDVIEIDGASNRGIDEVRSLIEAAQYRPAHGRYKIYIVDEVHQLTREAFNALLKTLEEPPAHVKFIMATTEAQKLPPTVLSRCQRYDFRRIAPADIEAHLAHIAAAENMSVSAAALATITREADGSMRDAQSLLEQVLAGSDDEVGDDDVARLLGIAGRDLVSECVRALLRGDAAKIVDISAQVRRFGYDPEKLAGDILEVVRHVAVARAAGEKALDDSIGEELKKLALELKDEREQLDLQRIFSSLLDTASDLRRGANPELVLEMGLLKVASLEPVASAAEVLAALREMRGDARGGGSGGAGGGSAGGGNLRGGQAGARDRGVGAAAGTGGANASGAGGAAAAGARGAATSAAEERAASTDAAPQGRSVSGETPGGGASGGQAREPGPVAERREPVGSQDPSERGEAAPASTEPQGALSDSISTPWEEFLELARKRYGLDMYVTLTNCEVLSMTPELLEIKPAGGALGASLNNPTVFARVREVAAEHFGAQIEVRLASKADSDGRNGVSVQALEDDRAARQRARAKDDPLVRRAVENFGGTIKEISLIEE